MKDWTGNKKSAFTTIGAAGHANHARQSEDYYATEPKATELLCELEQFSHDVWEPACGEGHMVKVLQGFLLRLCVMQNMRRRRNRNDYKNRG